MDGRTTAIRRLARWAYAALVVFVFVLAIAPFKEGGPPGADKLNHFAAFYVLGLFGALAFPRLPLWLLAAGLAGYGGAIELVQGLPLVGRDAEAADWVVDGIGVALALAPLALSGLRRGGRAGKPAD